ncbi:hypothetical protein N658DRAFT_450169 [Parathielavia hyrcaniae]|uniref:Aminoglycoside phosphotransferase domain-containing protein n=1 Tax=Parathielavia hyrcaniae TaxID=113614 RepID=A0AAN6Q044_9PEZI|nr:hypothetical protein N658DRAFT_450169 [Parathielavia hyrcaniae]
MLANPTHHHSIFPPHPDRNHDLLVTTNDPFHALSDSLASLTLTAVTAASPAPAQTQHQPPSSSPPHSYPHPQTLPRTHHASPDSNHPDPITITPLFPPGDNVIFAHSSFFTRRRHHHHSPLPTAFSHSTTTPTPDLPTPAQVRDEAARLGISTTTTNEGPGSNGAKLVPFPALGLLVKFGPGVSAAEGKAMMLLRRALASSLSSSSSEGNGEVLLPVPEVFGWRRDAGTGERFVYMDLPEGEEVLEERWGRMSEGEKEGVCVQLREVVRAWRRLRLGGVGFVGSVDNGPLRDEVFRGCTMAGAPPPGPFPTSAAFHDYFVSMAVTVSQTRQQQAGAAGVGQVRYTPHHLFPDDVPVVFTHGALHPRNIIVSAGRNPRIVSILGWDQAGWYPAYWELCKARRECSRRGGPGEWESRYLPVILDARDLSVEMCSWNVGALCQYWDYFVSSI